MKTILCILLVLAVSCSNKESNDIMPPVAEKITHELKNHAVTRIDNYFWLNDRSNPKVIEYLTKENEYTEKMMADYKDLRENLYNEIVGRIKKNDVSAPITDNGYTYISKYNEGQEYAVHYRKSADKEDAPEELLLDENERAADYEYYSLGALEISPDNSIACLAEDTVGRRLYTLKFKDLKTGKFYDDEIKNVAGDIAWAADNKTLFYAVKDSETLREFQIYKHILGTPVTSDVLVFEEKDETFSVSVYLSRSKEYLWITSESTLSSEYRFLESEKPHGEFQIFQPREKEHEYSVAHAGNYFYILTNWDAKNFRVMRTETTKLGKEHWQELLSHNPDVLIEDIEPFENFLAVEERSDGLSKIRIMKNEGDSYYIQFNEDSYVAGIGTNPEVNNDVIRYTYTSLTTPVTQYDYNMKTGEQTIVKRQEVVGDFKPEDYSSERLFAVADDGTKIPISIVYKKGYKKDGKAPLLLYAYGSYGFSMDPYFSSVRLSLLDRGFAFAIAHVRGGQEMGRQWYEDGKMLKKKNSFTDFIACAKYLIQENYTSPNSLYMQGGSAGGLLVGAVLNMAPELFKGAIAQVPFVDVVTTMLDESIPLTTGEYDEWGNPNEKKYFDYMLSYSPYDNVEAKDYPAMLVMTGLHDSQVQYWEPAKWVAKLRDMKTDNNLLLMFTNMDAGHGGASGRFKQHKETALEYCFLLKLQGIKK